MTRRGGESGFTPDGGARGGRRLGVAERARLARTFRITPAKLAFLVPLLAVGIPYWSLPLATLALPDDLIAVGLLAVFAAAVWLTWRLGSTVFKAAGLIGGVPAVVVMLRVVVEVTADSSTHNLWPFEVVIAAAVGAPIAVLGALLGRLLRRLLGPDPG